MIISMAELEKYFGKEATPAKMKEQIMTLLDEWTVSYTHLKSTTHNISYG